ncbi:MAG: hypothetical protein ACRCZ1_01020 [Cetobacterium sp.]
MALFFYWESDEVYYQTYDYKMAIRLVKKGFEVERLTYAKVSGGLLFEFEYSKELMAEVELVRLERIERYEKRRGNICPSPQLYHVNMWKKTKK